MPAATAIPQPAQLALWEYKTQIQLARRALRFATMARLEGLTGSSSAILASLDIDNWPLVVRHVDLKAIVSGAVMRVRGRDVDDPELNGHLVEDLRQQIELLSSAPG